MNSLLWNSLLPIPDSWLSGLHWLGYVNKLSKFNENVLLEVTPPLSYSCNSSQPFMLEHHWVYGPEICLDGRSWKMLFFVSRKVSVWQPQKIENSQSFFNSPTDAQVNCLKNNFKIYIKINIKTALTCFRCSHTIIRDPIIHACLC